MLATSFSLDCVLPDDFSDCKSDTIHYYYTIISFIIDIHTCNLFLTRLCFCLMISQSVSQTLYACYYYTIICFIIDIPATSFSLDCVLPDDFSDCKSDTIHYYYTIICFIIDILATSFSLHCVLPDDFSAGKSDTIRYYYTITYFIIDIRTCNLFLTGLCFAR